MCKMALWSFSGSIFHYIRTCCLQIISLGDIVERQQKQYKAEF